MTRGTRSGHRCPVRVVIELSGSGQWSGTVDAAPLPVGETPFEGRLELLRLLEALVDQPHDAVEDGNEIGGTDETDHDDHTDAPSDRAVHAGGRAGAAPGCCSARAATTTTGTPARSATRTWR